MDIRGYFIHINRLKLLEITESTLNKLKTHKVPGRNDGKEWQDILDFDFILYLNKEIILTNPTINCIFHSKKKNAGMACQNQNLYSIQTRIADYQ